MSIQALTWVIEECDATQGARNLMFAIANHADERGQDCWAAVPTLAREARMSRKGVQAALRRLEREGMITAHGRSPYATTIYGIPAMVGGEAASPPREDVDHQGAKMQDGNGRASSPEPSLEPSSKPDNGESDPVTALFLIWVEAMSKDPARTKLTADRRQKVKARLAEGYSTWDIEQAIRNVSRSPFHMGENDRGAEYNDLTLICRTGSKLESYRDMQPERAVPDDPVLREERALEAAAQAEAAEWADPGP